MCHKKGGVNVTQKIGRPKAEKPKAVYCNIRLDSDTENKLLEYCKENNITKGEAVRKAIKMLLKRKK